MVYPDISSDVKINDIDKSAVEADILDRFFSFLIDYLVISPFVLFVLYFVYQNGYQFLKQNPLAPENLNFQVVAAFSYIVLFSIVQILFVGLWRATPGQFFLKLRFESDLPTGVLQFRIFFRQIFVWVSFLLLGLPFLSMLTNKKRRTFYDQIADTTIITSKKSTPGFQLSFENEYKYWQALMVTLSLFIGGLLTSLLLTQYKQVVDRLPSFRNLEKQSFFCPQMNDVKIEGRLQTAIALNLIDQLSNECLDREADFVLWKNKTDQVPMAYWAKSLTTDDLEKEQQYQNKACDHKVSIVQAGFDIASEPSSTLACHFAKAFQKNTFNELLELLDTEQFLSLVLKYEILQENQTLIVQNTQLDDLLVKIEKYQNLKSVKSYLIGEYLNQLAQPEPLPKVYNTDRAMASVQETQTIQTETQKNTQPIEIDSENSEITLQPIDKIKKLLGEL